MDSSPRNPAQPLVTIVTSTYNQADYLDQAINSVLEQDYPNIEYRVFNDGSTDHTEAVLQKYTGKLYWETQPNMKENPTLNKGYKLAKGEIIGKLSSDDYYYPGLISAVVQAFNEHPEAIVVYPDFDVVDPAGKLIYTASSEYDYIKSIREHLCLPGVGAFFRRRLLQYIPGGLDVSFRRVSDLLFWWQAGLYGPFIHIPRSLGAFRVHSASQTTQGGSLSANETLRLIDTFYALPDLPAEVLAVKNEAYASAWFVSAYYLSREKNAYLPTCYRLLKSFLKASPRYLTGEWSERSRFALSYGLNFDKIRRIFQGLKALPHKLRQR